MDNCLFEWTLSKKDTPGPDLEMRHKKCYYISSFTPIKKAGINTYNHALFLGLFYPNTTISFQKFPKHNCNKHRNLNAPS